MTTPKNKVDQSSPFRCQSQPNLLGSPQKPSYASTDTCSSPKVGLELADAHFQAFSTARSNQLLSLLGDPEDDSHYSRVVINDIGDHSDQEKSAKQRSEMLEKLEQVVQNCDSSTADEVLTILEAEKEDGQLGAANRERLRNALSSDAIIGRKVREWQASKTLSVVMLGVGSLCLSAILFYLPVLVNEKGFNAMEYAQLSALTVCFISSVILLSFTKKKSSTNSSKEGEALVDQDYMGISEDIKAQMKDKLLNQIDNEGLIGEIKFLRQDDIMTYLAVREEYRGALFLAVGLMGVGLVALIFSLSQVSHAICIAAVCLVAPLSASMAFHQNLLASWDLKSVFSTSERFDWLLETIALALTVAALFLMTKGQAEPKYMATMLPVLGAFCTGSSLGIFKKVAQAKRRAGPRFVTSFIFYVSFALVILTPYLKYPSVSSQVHELERAGGTDYYARSGRGLPLAFVLLLGILATISAFSFCNALQHPQIRMSHVSAFIVLIPTLLYALLYFPSLIAEASASGVIAVCAAIFAVLVTNLLKSLDCNPLFASESKQ